MTVIVEWLNHNSDALTGLAALVAAGVAVYGVNEWKRQFKWRIEYNTARRYVRALHKVRESINRDVRNPAISNSEVEAAAEAAQLNGAKVTDENRHWLVYVKRWEKLSAARADLRGELLETEVLWGKGIREEEWKLQLLIGELYAKIHMHFTNPRSVPDSFDYLYYTDDKSAFSKRVDDAIDGIEQLLRPHL
jgi:hypothetical protein